MNYPEQYRRYFELFNQEEFWEAHEALEELWQVNGDQFLRGLIVFAAAFVHVQRNNPSGCRKVLDKCIEWLGPFAPRHQGLDVDRVLAHAHFCRDALDHIPTGGHLRDHLPFITLQPDE